MRDWTNGGASSGGPGELRPVALQESDVRALVGLIGDALAHRGSDLERKRLLLEGLARLVQADAWAWVIQRCGSRPNDFTCFPLIEGGFKSERERAMATGAIWSGNAGPIPARKVGSAFTLSRFDDLPDEEWHATPLYRNHREPAGLDDVLITGMYLSHQLVSTIGLHRRLGRPRFDERERTISRIVTNEIGWLHRIAMPESDLAAVGRLSPRLRHVMVLLASGRSRKELARELGISLHTANEYVSAVYSRLGVHTRAELMARFIQGSGLPDAARPPDSGGGHSLSERDARK